MACVNRLFVQRGTAQLPGEQMSSSLDVETFGWGKKPANLLCEKVSLCGCFGETSEAKTPGSLLSLVWVFCVATEKEEVCKNARVINMLLGHGAG